MKIPKYVEKLIARRCRLAKELNSTDVELSHFLERNGIEVEEYDIYGGCEMYANPDGSGERIREAILLKETEH